MTTGIDWQQSITLANNSEDVAKELLNMLISELPTNLQDITHAKTSGDNTTLLHQVHKLHGACCYCGVPTLRNSLNQLETLLKSEQEDNEQVAQLTEQVEQNIQVVLTEYAQLELSS
tara:strand:+ start:492 stop:842 length:351 start_codon:yes stop_codon:yes gene_type:complete